MVVGTPNVLRKVNEVFAVRAFAPAITSNAVLMHRAVARSAVAAAGH